MTTNPLVYLIDPEDSGREIVGAQLDEIDLEFQAFCNADAFLDSFEPRRVGCVVTELRLGNSTAIQLVKKLRQRSSTLPVILLTAHATVPLAVQAFKAGISDVLERPIEPFRLWECITSAFESHGQEMHEAVQRHSVKNRISQLSGQELQVLQLMLQGEPNKRIAAQLGVSPRTIVFRRKSLMQKMNAKSVPELARIIHSVTSDTPQISMEPVSLLDIRVAASFRDAIENNHSQNGEFNRNEDSETSALLRRRH